MPWLTRGEALAGQFCAVNPKWWDDEPHFVQDTSEDREITKGDYCEARECGGCAEGDTPCDGWLEWWAEILADHHR